MVKYIILYTLLHSTKMHSHAKKTTATNLPFELVPKSNECSVHFHILKPNV